MRESLEIQSNCPIDFVISIIGNKWSIPILRDLFQGPRRTSQLIRSLTGISPRTLSERLRELEEWGLVTRTVYAEVPPRVEYALTERGHDVRPFMDELKLLGERWKRTMIKQAEIRECVDRGGLVSELCSRNEATDN